MKGHLLLLVGQIASGKSTFARHMQAQGAIVVNDDALIALFHGDDRRYDKRLKPLYKAVENTAIVLGLTLGKTVIVDRPCMKRLTRARYIGIAKSLDCQVSAICFPIEDSNIHALRRFQADSRGHSLATWRKKAARIWQECELVQRAEGVDSIISYAEAETFWDLAHLGEKNNGNME